MSAMPRHPQTPSTFAPGVLMSRRARIVVLICALITGAARAALADRGAGDRERANAAGALQGYATRYVLAAARGTPTHARPHGLAGRACHTPFPAPTPPGPGLKLHRHGF